MNTASPFPRRMPLPGDTIAQKFALAVQARGDAIALRQKEYGVWREMGWREFGTHAQHMALGLAALGFESGEVGAILANTRWEWSASDYAILMAGGVSCGIYPTDAAPQVQYLCADSASTVLFVEDDEQLDKALSVRDGLPRLRKIIVMDMDGLHDLSDPQVMGLEDLMALGQAHGQAHPQLLQQRLDSRRAEDLAILIYTSGTTGKPKGAMISHNNLAFAMETFAVDLPQGPDDDKMAFLPLCHVVERAAGQLMSLQTGSRLNYVENPDTVIDNLREIAPTSLLAVPRIWEKLYSLSTLTVKDATRLQKRAYAWALQVGTEAANREEAGQPVTGLLAARRWLARSPVSRQPRAPFPRYPGA